MEGELVDMLSTPLFVKVAREIADGVRLFDGAPPRSKAAQRDLLGRGVCAARHRRRLGTSP